MNNKGSVVFSVILTIIVLALVGYIIYDKVAEPKYANNNEKGSNVVDNNEVTKCPDCNCSEKTGDVYQKISGKYKPSDEVSAGELYLYNDGTFEYEFCGEAICVRDFGNYIIVDNKIKFNAVARRGSDEEIKLRNNYYEYTINEDDTLAGPNPGTTNRVTLIKEGAVHESQVMEHITKHHTLEYHE